MSAPSTEGKILFYEGPHYHLSNFSSFAIVLRREIWMTVEHAYQARKFFPGHEASIIGEIKRALSAHEAKQIAKANKLRMRPDWQQIKLAEMEKLLRAKFDQHPYVQRKLLETDTLWLIEDSPTDSFWGRGPDWKGQNQLGQLWMKIRTEEQIRQGKKFLANG
jgi:ribA/ribD-fused uncharacterized protein